VDRLDLLVEVILALVLVHLLFRSRMDRPVELPFFYLGLEYIGKLLKSFLNGKRFKKVLFFFNADTKMRTHRIGYLRGRDTSKAGVQCVGICVWRNPQKLFNQRMDLLQKPVGSKTGVVYGLHLSDMGVKHPVCILFDTNGFSAVASFDDDLDLSIILPLGLQYPAERPDGVNLVGVWLINRCVVLGCEKNIPFSAHRLFQRSDRARPADLECNLCIGKDHDIAYRNHRITLNVGGHLV
jgi:hypothetical protein